MKKALQLSLITLLFQNALAQTRSAGALSSENIPDIPAALIESSTRYQNTRSANFVAFHPQTGSILISTRFAETNQLHMVQSALSQRKQITFFKEPVSNAAYCKDKAHPGFLFLKDQGGNEFSQIFWMNESDGKVSLITEGGKSQNNLPLWNNKGSKFAYTSTRRNQKDYDLYIGDLNQQPQLKLASELTGSWQVHDWSPDDKKILLIHYISINKSELFIYEIEKNSLTEILPSKEEISYATAVFDATGTGLYYCSDDGSDFQVLNYLELATGRKRAITVTMRWDVTGLRMNESRTKLLFSVNENGFDKLYYLNTGDNKYKALNEVPKGIITGMAFHPNGNTIGFSINNANSPGDVFTLNLDSRMLSRWTESETGGLDPNLFPKPEEILFPTFDEVTGVPRLIPALLYKPNVPNKKFPVLISIHGGPEGQSRPGFNALLSYMVNEMGIAVIMPNVRGSSGYGKTYLKLDNGFLREGAVKDIGALLKWIKQRGDLDTAKIAVMGGSYGGYMSLACMVAYNAQLRCGIDVVGISNFVSFLKNTEDYRKDLRRVEYGDERDPEMNTFLEKISPLNHVKEISKPIFIVQGANDPRVPRTEAEQMKQKLQAQGNTVWYLLAADEGHGFKKKSNVDTYQWSSLLFLQEYLLK